MTPPPYPRVPHLVGGRGSRDDLVLSNEGVAALFSGQVIVEEKLDGANAMIWSDNGALAAALRSGPGAQDRAGQLGPLRAWITRHDSELRRALEGWAVLYAEWLYLRHTVAYSQLPSYLFALDLWHPETGFATIAERDATGLVAPPELARGPLRSVDDVESMLGLSAWSSESMEGVVVRRSDQGDPRLAKLVRAGWHALDDESWRRGRPTNRLAEGVAAWR